MDPLGPLDRWAGDAMERVTRAHHRRRLGQLGWERALDPPDDGSLWCAGDPPVRTGNALEVLVDGAAALPRIAAEIMGAQSHVHVAGWHLQAGFGLVRGSETTTVRDALSAAAERVPVRVLQWAGAPLPVFPPGRSDVRSGRDALVRDTRIDAVLDAHERPFHCHHEKLVIVDDRVAFVSGIDMTALGGDRFDSPAHDHRPLGWHDASSCLRGPAVADVAGHFRARWQEVAGEPLPEPGVPEPAGDVKLQVVRTLCENMYDFAPRGDFRILEAYTRALRSAREFVYLENQFLWSPELVAILAAKLRDPPTPGFRVVVVLPAKANNGADDTRGQLGVLVEADDGAGRFLACTLYARDPGGGPAAAVYVHAKIGIVDDRWLTIGSANVNAHSLYNDGEVNVITQDRALARDVRLRLWAEHLETSVDAVSGDPAAVVDEQWRPIAERQRKRLRTGEPLDHRLAELAGVSRRSMRLLGPVQGLLVDG
ncbi:MAG: phospholipase D family protein [Actinomycetota bacterium]|nr:phospholipase D family protein [Actinomycetota bacterium]